MAINWAHLAILGGENFEDFVAACLIQRYPKGWQTKPGKGDGGIDFIHPTPEGFRIYQIKKFSEPLTSSQKSQVKNSWKRFSKTYVDKGKRVAEYQLVTAWTPTDKYRIWLLDEVTNDSKFEIGWQGIAFLNSLAGEFQGTFARFFEGPDPLERYVTQKAMLAAVPLSEAEKTSFIEAVLKRADDTQDLLDLSADHYFINPSIRMIPPDGELPLPTNEPGVMHEIEVVDDYRYRIISVVPKSDQAAEFDPIDLKVTFAPAPGTDEEQQLKDWREWGVPFTGITGEIKQSGGPLSSPTPRSGLLQLVPELLAAQTWPPLSLERQDRPETPLTFEVTEVTRGTIGGGIRIVGITTGNIVRVEVRSNSEVAGSSQSITLSGIAGNGPEEVERQLQLLVGGPAPTRYRFTAAESALLTATLEDVDWISDLLRLATDLKAIQHRVAEQIVFPELNTITKDQEDWISKVAGVLRGEEHEVQWQDVLLTSGLDASVEFAKFTFPGILVIPNGKVSFALGSFEYTLVAPFQHNYLNPQTPPDFNYMNIRKGDVLRLTKGPKSRRTFCLPAPEWANDQYMWIQ